VIDPKVIDPKVIDPKVIDPKVIDVDGLLLGLSIGVAAGISPGPLLVLVITSTLKSGWRAGALSACAPLMTDVIVVPATLLALDQLPHRALAVLGVVGGVLVVGTGLATIRDAREATLIQETDVSANSARRALRQAGIVNLLSPHPWISWASVLGPLTIATWRDRPANAVMLVTGFYLTLVGAKLAIAGLVAGGRRYLSDSGYRRALTATAVLLLAVGVALIVDFAPRL
jgi:threonine/homoserine/homoserine lactone efflux protein